MNQQEQRRTSRVILVGAAVVLALAVIAALFGYLARSFPGLSYLLVFALGILTAVLVRRRRA